MKIALVTNAAAVPPARAAHIERLLVAAAPGTRCARTSMAGETLPLVRKAIAAGATRIVIAGGDGTVHEAANAIIGTAVELAVIPAGSGNDYARSLGVPPAIDDAVAFALRSPALATDAGELVCTGVDGRELRRVFVNIAEAGFGANVVRYARSTQRVANPWLAYQLAILAALVTLRRAQVTVSSDDGAPRCVASSNLIVGIGQYFGSGMRPLPGARIDDGWFDVAHIRDASRFEIARQAPMLRNGIDPDHPQVEQYRCRSLRAESPQAVPVEADGEWLGFLPAAFTKLPGALQVVRTPTAVV
jgi:diacylglycerol kinase (ATP)